MKPVRIRRKADSGRERKIGFFRKHFAGEIFSSVTLKCDQPVALEELKRRVMYVVKQAEGEILRGKGILSAKNTAQDEPKNLVFHFVPGYLSIEPTSAESDQVCFIGTGLDREQIKALWNELLPSINLSKVSLSILQITSAAGFSPNDTLTRPPAASIRIFLFLSVIVSIYELLTRHCELTCCIKESI